MNTKPDIIAVLEAYGVHVNRSYGWAPVRCPFHGDTQASASVNAEYQKFNCHGCGVHGDAWDLIMEHESCDLKTAISIGQQFNQSTVAATPVRNTVSIPGRRGRR